MSEAPASTEDLLTVKEAAAALRVSSSTMYYWRQKRIGPPAFRLPNGEVRIRRRDLWAWFESHAEAAA